MDWATRQLEEVINKLTSLPTLYIILPDFSGFDIAGYADFPNKLSTAYGSGKINDTKNYAGSLNSSSSSSNAAVS
jgi:cation transporter-like permease